MTNEELKNREQYTQYLVQRWQYRCDRVLSFLDRQDCCDPEVAFARDLVEECRSRQTKVIIAYGRNPTGRAAGGVPS